MSITIRRAVKEDCPRLLELITELAVYEKAPDQVTVTLEHFEKSGFGEKPVWWSFVAE
ncbi:MAG: GNAT family N-acetyltransferase, partial [Chitinophagaceae bacterium]